MSSTASMTIQARLDRLPRSWFVWRVVVLISLGGFFEFYDLFFTAYVAPGMIKSGLFTPQSLGPLASLHVIAVAGFGTFVFATFAGLAIGYILNVAGVPGVAAFIGVAMLVVMASIGFYGPRTRELALEQIAH